MKLRILAALAGATLTLTVSITSAAAATTSPVNALSCALAGGQATIPAGSELEVRLGAIVKNRGLATDFLAMQTTTLSMNGAGAIDISGYWGAPVPFTDAVYGEVWRTRVIYDTGVVLGLGETVHFTFVLDEPHLSLDGLLLVNDDSRKPVLFQPAVYTYDCTVTAV
jgi:hypothetical protein